MSLQPRTYSICSGSRCDKHLLVGGEKCIRVSLVTSGMFLVPAKLSGVQPRGMRGGVPGVGRAAGRPASHGYFRQVYVSEELEGSLQVAGEGLKAQAWEARTCPSRSWEDTGVGVTPGGGSHTLRKLHLNLQITRSSLYRRGLCATFNSKKGFTAKSDLAPNFHSADRDTGLGTGVWAAGHEGVCGGGSRTGVRHPIWGNPREIAPPPVPSRGLCWGPSGSVVAEGTDLCATVALLGCNVTSSPNLFSPLGSMAALYLPRPSASIR